MNKLAEEILKALSEYKKSIIADSDYQYGILQGISQCKSIIIKEDAAVEVECGSSNNKQTEV